jgi:hypothetical protein
MEPGEVVGNAEHETFEDIMEESQKGVLLDGGQEEIR